MSVKQIPLSGKSHLKLQKFCEKKEFMRGEEYYKVPDFDSALLFLLGEYSEKRKRKSEK